MTRTAKLDNACGVGQHCFAMRVYSDIEVRQCVWTRTSMLDNTYILG